MVCFSVVAGLQAISPEALRYSQIMHRLPQTFEDALSAFDNPPKPMPSYGLSSILPSLDSEQRLTADEEVAVMAETIVLSLTPSRDRPSGTYFGPTATGVDDAMVAYWEYRARISTHPLLRARYNHAVWDLKRKATGHRPGVAFAKAAIRAYVNAVEQEMVTNSNGAAQSLIAAVQLSLAIKDADLLSFSKKSAIDLFVKVTRELKVGPWRVLFDALWGQPALQLSPEESGILMSSLENVLSRCSTPGDDFDPYAAKYSAVRLAEHFRSNQDSDDVARVLEKSGEAFRFLASQTSAMMATSYLSDVIDDFERFGLTTQSQECRLEYEARANELESELVPIVTEMKVDGKELHDFVAELVTGSAEECLERIADHFTPRIPEIEQVMQEMARQHLLLGMMPQTNVGYGREAATVGSIDEEPDGRLILALSRDIDLRSPFLAAAIDGARDAHSLTPASLVSFFKRAECCDPKRVQTGRIGNRLDRTDR